MSPLELILRLNSSGFDNPLNRSRSTLGAFNQSLRNMSTAPVNAMGSAFTGLATKIAAAFTAWQAGAALFRATSKSLNMAADLESTSMAFKTMIGNANLAFKTVSAIKKLGAETPFEFPELADAGRKLIAFGEAADTVPATLRRIGDVASGIQAPISEIAEIYGKARVQGTLFAEDINQLTGRGIPIIQQFARILKVSEGEVKKLASEGQITFPLLEQALVNLTSAGGQFHGMMQQQSGTTKGLMSTLRDTINELYTAFGTPINDALKPILSGAIGLVAEMQPLAASLGQAFVPALEGIRDFVAQAGEGGNLVAMLGERLRESFTGLANIAMVPIRVMIEALPNFGSAMLTAVVPVGAWLMKSMESSALLFGRTLMMQLHAALAAMPRWFISEEALEGLNRAANESGKQGNQAGKEADGLLEGIKPGLDQAGKEMTQAFKDLVDSIRSEVSSAVEKNAEDRDAQKARDIVKNGRKSDRQMIGPVRDSDPFKDPSANTFESQMGEMDTYDWEKNPGNRRRPKARAGKESEKKEEEKTEKKKEENPPAKQQSTTVNNANAAANKAFQAPGGRPGRRIDDRYDEEGRRHSDGRKRIVSRPPGWKAPQAQAPSPGTAKNQDQRRAAAASGGGQNDRPRWDVVLKIEQHLSNVAAA